MFGDRGSNRRPRRAVFSLEVLEGRALLAEVTFQVPYVADLAGGRKVRAAFERMVGSLQTQLTLNAPKDADPDHVIEVVNRMVDQFESASISLFGASKPLTTLLIYQGETTRGAINAFKIQLDTGLANRYQFDSNAFMEIKELTQSRDVWPVGTPLQKYLVLSTETSDGLESVTRVVSTPGAISNATAAAIIKAETYAYQSEVLLAANRNPRIANTVIDATARLNDRVDAAVNREDFAAQVQLATADFADALIHEGGLFGPGGAIGRRYAQLPNVAKPLGIGDASTFDNLQYRQVETTAPLVLYRNFSSSANRYGRFLSSDVFASPTEAVRRLALDQSWYGTNQAYFVQNVTLPANTTVYVGRVAPIFQGIFQREARPSLYPGRASQYLILNSRDPKIIWDDLRATGT